MAQSKMIAIYFIEKSYDKQKISSLYTDKMNLDFIQVVIDEA
ncbi:protein of unknown function [Moritella yayanosii]|uniref:Uncharacterized protein n=1 Tax=Moritella yayanosii TaxID=69539 RepID=A0A330LU89_9GAMM|nr:protein of unknown function [Moritella yayanosii]